VALAVVSARQPGHAGAPITDAAPAAPQSIESVADPQAQAPLTRSEYRLALIDAGADPRLADGFTPQPSHGSTQRHGRTKSATHIFDSKESVKRAASATARAGAAGYLHEASQHGIPVEAGEPVIILDRGWEFSRVLAPGPGAEGWMLNALIESERNP
jgi:hypothetical protein